MTFIPPQARKQYAPARSTRITKISPMKPLVQLELWEAQEIAKTAPEAKECEPVAFSQLIRQLNPVEPSFKPSQKQLRAVWDAMKHGRWVSLAEIAFASRQPEASCSARIRQLSKDYGIPHQKRQAKDGGLWEYCLSPP